MANAPSSCSPALQEMFQNAIVQKSFVVDFQIEPVQCEGCRHVASEQTWKALLQVRQAADHKRTFFLLEQVQIHSSSSPFLKCPAVVVAPHHFRSQLILKHNAHAHCTNIVEVADGMDFFYQNKSHALKMLDFVSSVLPVRNRGASEKLISADTKSATANVQMTYPAPPSTTRTRTHAHLNQLNHRPLQLPRRACTSVQGRSHLPPSQDGNRDG
jgi:nonsense-mediated mRNA decay protein 3